MPRGGDIVPGNLFSLKQKQARGNVPGESLIGLLLSVCLCISVSINIHFIQVQV
jgi:hypothetical protein